MNDFDRGVEAARMTVAQLLADKRIYTTDAIRGVAGALFAIDTIWEESTDE